MTEAVASVATTNVVTAGVQGKGSFRYRDFSNMKPPEFDGIKDLIVSMRWIYDMEGCFLACSYPEEWKLKCALNLLCLGTKDWWKLVTSSCTLDHMNAITWE